MTAYVALEKQNKKNGQLMYVKGSHLRGVQKHKLSLKCMSDVTTKVYNERFRGWGFTFWG